MTPQRRQRGSVTIFIAVLAVSFVVVAGLAVDGGRKLGALSHARQLADNAARAGAQQLDEPTYRQTGHVTLNPTAARRAALNYLATTGNTGTVTVNDARITVTVQLDVTTRILPGPWHVTATQSATAIAGIEGAT